MAPLPDYSSLEDAVRVVFEPYTRLCEGEATWMDGRVCDGDCSDPDEQCLPLDLHSLGDRFHFPSPATVAAAAAEWIEGGVFVWDGQLLVPAPTLTADIIREAIRRWYTQTFAGTPERREVELEVRLDEGMPEEAEAAEHARYQVSRINQRVLVSDSVDA